MKIKILTLLLLVGVGAKSFSQDGSAMNKIAQKTCEYMAGEDLNGLTSNEKTVKLGVFMLKEYTLYEEELNKEGIDIDFEDQSSSEDFGQKIGFIMMNICPETLISLAEGNNVVSQRKQENILSFTGKIKSITGDDFSFIQVEDNNGIVKSFLWLSNFKGSEKLITGDSVIGTQVKIKYKNTECFSPKLQEYIIRKEIVEIAYL